MKRTFPLTLLALFLVINLQAESRPNILYLYVDDMGWGAIGPNGQAARRAAGKMAVLTPHLDKLAAEGINFTRAYGATVCSPARSSQQTGFHQGHTFADRNDPDNAKKAIRAEDLTMGDVLAEAGYVTGYWGKWGYGGSKDMRNPTIDNVQTLPTSHGYQHIVAELHHVRAHTFFQPTLWVAPSDKKMPGGLMLQANTMKPFIGNDRYPAQPSNHNHSDYPAVAYCDDVYAFAALDFVRTQAVDYVKNGRPFFGLVAFQVPHGPYGDIAQLPEWQKAYADVEGFSALSQQARQWAAMVTRIDAHIGHILAALDDPNGDGDTSDSVADNTLVVFQSDNGAASNDGIKAFGSTANLRGAKGSIYEGGIRVPTIMRWPKNIHASSSLKAGTDSHVILDVSDLLPTFSELAEAPIPLGLDGVSVAPFLVGEDSYRKRDYIIHEAGAGVSIIRGNYKLIKRRTIKSAKKHKRGQTVSGLALYDLDKDQAESNNIAAKHPELVKELGELLQGERVFEPHGFANTYHRWTGADGAPTSDAGNWSDYRYANKGVEYMADDGAPQRSWTTLVENKEAGNNTAMVNDRLEVLALEVRGSAGSQHLVIPQKAHLHARNELRVSQGGTLKLAGGEVSSMRWVDVTTGGVLDGHGRIDCDLYVSDGARIRVGAEASHIEVGGNAHIGGALSVDPAASVRIKADGKVLVIKAEKILGRFSAIDGGAYKLSYTAQAVFIEPK